MLKTIWEILKVAGIIIRNILIIVFALYVIVSIKQINKELRKIQTQNTELYDSHAQAYKTAISAILTLADYANTIQDVDAARAQKILDLVKDIEAKNVERELTLGNFIKQNEEKPNYEYLKSMIVYLVQQYGDSDMVSIGTGTVIRVDDDATLILTNKHVCTWETGTTCFVYQDGKKYEISLVEKNELDHDMQVVKTSEVIPGKIAIRGIKEVGPQDRVFCVGNNNGNYFQYSEGTVAGFSREGDLMAGMPSGPGNSGSGIFTQDGYLTGLLFAGQVFNVGESGNDQSLDTGRAICVNSIVLRFFLAKYLH